MDTKVYLGDGVYVDHISGMFILTTENGVSVTNKVYLEPEVAKRFLDYYRTVLEGRRM